MDPFSSKQKPEPEFVVTAALIKSAKAFLTDWVTAGHGTEQQFMTALRRFGEVGDAKRNSPDVVWDNWLLISRRASALGDFELVVQVFFVAWRVKGNLSFDMMNNLGFASARGALKPIVQMANAAAMAAPETFAVRERSDEPPVSRLSIISGTNQILQTL